jgi:hypothetical protein
MGFKRKSVYSPLLVIYSVIHCLHTLVVLQTPAYQDLCFNGMAGQRVFFLRVANLVYGLITSLHVPSLFVGCVHFLM